MLVSNSVGVIANQSVGSTTPNSNLVRIPKQTKSKTKKSSKPKSSSSVKPKITIPENIRLDSNSINQDLKLDLSSLTKTTAAKSKRNKRPMSARTRKFTKRKNKRFNHFLKTTPFKMGRPKTARSRRNFDFYQSKGAERIKVWAYNRVPANDYSVTLLPPVSPSTFTKIRAIKEYEEPPTNNKPFVSESGELFRDSNLDERQRSISPRVPPFSSFPFGAAEINDKYLTLTDHLSSQSSRKNRNKPKYGKKQKKTRRRPLSARLVQAPHLSKYDVSNHSFKSHGSLTQRPHSSSSILRVKKPQNKLNKSKISYRRRRYSKNQRKGHGKVAKHSKSNKIPNTDRPSSSSGSSRTMNTPATARSSTPAALQSFLLGVRYNCKYCVDSSISRFNPTYISKATGSTSVAVVSELHESGAIYRPKGEKTDTTRAHSSHSQHETTSQTGKEIDLQLDLTAIVGDIPKEIRSSSSQNINSNYAATIVESVTNTDPVDYTSPKNTLVDPDHVSKVHTFTNFEYEDNHNYGNGDFEKDGVRRSARSSETHPRQEYKPRPNQLNPKAKHAESLQNSSLSITEPPNQKLNDTMSDSATSGNLTGESGVQNSLQHANKADDVPVSPLANTTSNHGEYVSTWQQQWHELPEKFDPNLLDEVTTSVSSYKSPIKPPQASPQKDAIYALEENNIKGIKKKFRGSKVNLIKVGGTAAAISSRSVHSPTRTIHRSKRPFSARYGKEDPVLTTRSAPLRPRPNSANGYSTTIPKEISQYDVGSSTDEEMEESTGKFPIQTKVFISTAKNYPNDDLIRVSGSFCPTKKSYFYHIPKKTVDFVPTGLPYDSIEQARFKNTFSVRKKAAAIGGFKFIIRKRR